MLDTSNPWRDHANEDNAVLGQLPSAFTHSFKAPVESV